MGILTATSENGPLRPEPDPTRIMVMLVHADFQSGSYILDELIMDIGSCE